MVVDCGGGTVDITVHEIQDKQGSLKELHKATGGPYGSIGVDMEFENLLCEIFGSDFIEHFKTKLSSGFVDLMTAFEARKRSVNMDQKTPSNISLPFAFINAFKKYKGTTVEAAVKKFNSDEISYCPKLGMLRIKSSLIQKLFEPVTLAIIKHIAVVLNSPSIENLNYLFLVGGFAESQILQHAIRNAFKPSNIKVIIPQEVSLAILKGAVLFGLDPTIISIRRSRMTYGIGVLNRFVHGLHPLNKLIVRDNIEWCADIYDKFVLADQSIGLGDSVTRSYTPAKEGQRCIVLYIYCSERDDARFITDHGVYRCGSLMLDLDPDNPFISTSKDDSIRSQYLDIASQSGSDNNGSSRREVKTRMIFGDTEIKCQLIDVITGKCMRSDIDFLSL